MGAEAVATSATEHIVEGGALAYRCFDLHTPHCAQAQPYREAITRRVRHRCRHAVEISAFDAPPGV